MAITDVSLTSPCAFSKGFLRTWLFQSLAALGDSARSFDSFQRLALGQCEIRGFMQTVKLEGATMKLYTLRRLSDETQCVNFPIEAFNELQWLPGNQNAHWPCVRVLLLRGQSEWPTAMQSRFSRVTILEDKLTLRQL